MTETTPASGSYLFLVPVAGCLYGIIGFAYLLFTAYHNSIDGLHPLIDKIDVSLQFATVLSKFLFIAAIVYLLRLLSKMLGDEPAKWVAVSVIWSIVGLIAMNVALYHSNFIADTLNNAASKRFNPDNVMQILYYDNEATREDLKDGHFLKSWSPVRRYWTEALGIVAIAFAAGFAVRAGRRWGPRWDWEFPVFTVFALSLVYSN